MELSLEEFNVPCENASTPVPMLYQSGYLTIDYYNKEDDVYVLHFPNYEVCQGMVYSFLALRHHHPQGMDGEEEKGSVKKTVHQKYGVTDGDS